MKFLTKLSIVTLMLSGSVAISQNTDGNSNQSQGVIIDGGVILPAPIMPRPQMDCDGSGVLKTKAQCDMLFAQIAGRETNSQTIGNAWWNLSSSYQSQGFTHVSSQSATRIPVVVGDSINPRNFQTDVFISGLGKIVLSKRGKNYFELTENYTRTSRNGIVVKQEKVVIKVTGVLQATNGGFSIKVTSMNVDENPQDLAKPAGPFIQRFNTSVNPSDIK